MEEIQVHHNKKGDCLRIEKDDDRLLVYKAGTRLGSVVLYNNPCHMKNCYLKLDLDRLDISVSKELFHRLGAIAGRTLQAMISSEDVMMAQFLAAGGFICKRKCYEVEAGLKDYIGGQAHIPLVHYRTGEAEYEESCQIMFDHYVATHEAINPWTADYACFCEKMPGDVICAKQDDQIVDVAFVEDNEIAYIGGTDRYFFDKFARCVSAAMLANYDTICFECDDCDWAAMMLKSLFVNQDKRSFDTYIRGDSI